MFNYFIAGLGSIGSLLGAYAVYVTATGKNKTDIGAIVNEQINTILKTKDTDIATLRTDLKDLKTLVDTLNSKIEDLTSERLKDKTTINALTFELEQKTIEVEAKTIALNEMTIDRDHWKNMFNGTKGTTKESNQFY